MDEYKDVKAGNLVLSRLCGEIVVGYEKLESKKPNYERGIKMIIKIIGIQESREGDKLVVRILLNGRDFSFLRYELLPSIERAKVAAIMHPRLKDDGKLTCIVKEKP